ncbi:MAG: ComEC/Rec2 family competence protein [Fastidiosipilaceae bacterium]|jgi:competence protein ComEC
MARKTKRFTKLIALLLSILTLSGCQFLGPVLEELDVSEWIPTSTQIETVEITEIKQKETVDVSGETLQIHVLDVGQGSSMLLRSGEHSILIDGGPRESSSFVVSYLNKQNVDYIDLMVASHFHDDHINGLVGTLHTRPVETVMLPPDSCKRDTRVCQSFFAIISEKGCETIVPTVGEIFDLGDIHMTIVSPASYGHSNHNNDSIGLRIDYFNTSLLVMGDLEEEEEIKALNSGIDLDVDLFIANHHGSDTSNIQELLDQVTPELIVISVGSDNQYGHPSEDVLARFQDTGATIYRTDTDGTLLFESDGHEITQKQVNQQKEQRHGQRLLR